MKAILRSPIFTAALFVVAAALLAFGTVGAVQAAPRITSDSYDAQIQLDSIDTMLLENGKEQSDFMSWIKDEGGLKIGKEYSEAISVKNNGSIPEYVRVTIHKYWVDAEGKAVDLDPSLIKLNFPKGTGWTIDDSASTKERTVLYYDSVVQPGDTTSALSDKFAIDSSVSTAATKIDGLYVLDYGQSGEAKKAVEFRIDIVADAVQDHNGQAAMKSAWGHTK
jgi:hypothetical protein